MYIRSYPKPAHSYSLHGYHKIVACVTGTGLGAVMQAVLERPDDVFLIWITSDPLQFGKAVMKNNCFLINFLPQLV